MELRVSIILIATEQSSARLNAVRTRSAQRLEFVVTHCFTLYHSTTFHSFSFSSLSVSLTLRPCFDCCWRLIGNISNWFGVNLVMVLDFLVKKYRQKFNPNTFHKNSSSNSFLIPFYAICSCCIRSQSQFFGDNQFLKSSSPFNINHSFILLLLFSTISRFYYHLIVLFFINI